jgi:hypothetical protein
MTLPTLDPNVLAEVLAKAAPDLTDDDVDALWNFGPHDVSIVQYLLGNPRHTRPFGSVPVSAAAENNDEPAGAQWS